MPDSRSRPPSLAGLGGFSPSLRKLGLVNSLGGLGKGTPRSPRPLFRKKPTSLMGSGAIEAVIEIKWLVQRLALLDEVQHLAKAGLDAEAVASSLLHGKTRI